MTKKLITAMALVILWHPMGCSCDEELVKVPDPQIDVVDVLGGGRTSEGMTEIVVGEGELAADNTYPIRLESYGNRAVRVAEVVVEVSQNEDCPVSGASSFTVDPFDGVLQIDEAQDLNLHFQPVMPGGAASTIKSLSSAAPKLDTNISPRADRRLVLARTRCGLSPSPPSLSPSPPPPRFDPSTRRSAA